MTVREPQHARLNALAQAWWAFRSWRRSRPFNGGLLLLLAGVEIFGSTQLSLNGLSFQMGPTGFLSWLIPTILAACGVLMWITPQQRMFYAIVGTVTAVYSLIAVNLGGFFVGLLLGMVGGALGFAWTPLTPTSTESADEGPTGDDGPTADGGPTVLDDAPADHGMDLLTDTLPQPRNPLTEQTDPHRKPPLLTIIMVLVGISAFGAIALESLPAQADACPAPTKPRATVPAPTHQPTTAPATTPPGGTGDGTGAGGPGDNLVGDLIDGVTGLLPGDAAETAVATPTPTGSPSVINKPKPDGEPAPKPTRCTPASTPDKDKDPAPSVKRLAAEPGQPPVARTPSLMTGSKVTMYGLRIDGIVDLPTAKGSLRVLKFSMTRAVTNDFRLAAPGSANQTMLFTTGTLTVSGDVEFYATRFVGTILGVKLTLTPDSPLPPDGIPLPVPVISFDDPEMRLVYVDCDKLETPDTPLTLRAER